MGQEPVPGVLDHCVECPWFLKKVGSAGTDDEFFLAALLGKCSAVES
jgi:hypothetical protein